ncbi:hypothetical protein LSAT2_009755, partial [Lamellibrachia satsuma]
TACKVVRNANTTGSRQRHRAVKEATKKALYEFNDSPLAARVSTEDIKTAPTATKADTAEGIDGIYRKFQRDMPITSSCKFAYADNVTLRHLLHLTAKAVATKISAVHLNN